MRIPLHTSLHLFSVFTIKTVKEQPFVLPLAPSLVFVIASLPCLKQAVYHQDTQPEPRAGD
jgi:hypothetical protein